jgi:hypothetical protein
MLFFVCTLKIVAFMFFQLVLFLLGSAMCNFFRIGACFHRKSANNGAKRLFF